MMQTADYTHLVAVAGSGERVIGLMDNQALKTITAVDINIESLYLLQLKLESLTYMETNQYLKFIGHYDSGKEVRRRGFDIIKGRLSPECREYWEDRIHLIEKGILNAGHFENFLQRVRPLLYVILGKNFILRCKQLKKYRWIGPRWKIVSWFFTRQWVYRICGNQDSAFISDGAAVSNIPTALTKLINSGKASASFIFHLIFNGHLRHMKECDLPPSLQEKILFNIRERLINNKLMVNYHQADILEYVGNSKNNPAERTFYSLSDILSFEDHNYLQKLIESCLQTSGSQIIFRSFLKNRLTYEQVQHLIEAHRNVKMLDAQESSGMYQVIAISS